MRPLLLFVSATITGFALNAAAAGNGDGCVKAVDLSGQYFRPWTPQGCNGPVRNIGAPLDAATAACRSLGGEDFLFVSAKANCGDDESVTPGASLYEVLFVRGKCLFRLNQKNCDQVADPIWLQNLNHPPATHVQRDNPTEIIQSGHSQPDPAELDEYFKGKRPPATVAPR